jgi:glycosyltransferase involved in cell wall biosynthesis
MVDPAAWSLTYDVPLCEALAREGHDVTLYTTKFAHDAMPVASGAKIVEWFYRRSMKPLPRRVARGIQHPIEMHRLARHLRKTKPDVVHVQWSVIDRIDVAVWKNLAKMIPVVFTAHNSVGRTTDALDAQQLRAFDAVVAHTQFGADGLRSQYGIDHVWHIPMGADISLRTLPTPSPLPVEIPDGPVVTMPGLLRRYKGIDVLLEAWPSVRNSVLNATLLLAGRPMGMALPDPLPEGVVALPRFLTQPEFAWALKRADIVCLPYLSIDLSGVLLSAIACGCATVVSDVGGLSEYKEHGATVVPKGNVAELANALAALLADRTSLEVKQAEAEHAATLVFNWDAIARQYTQHYSELARDKVPAASASAATRGDQSA